MAIFGQVWFACLVGFGAGVLLTWLLWVRPMRRRLDEAPRPRYDADSEAGLEPVRQNSLDLLEPADEPDGYPRVDSYFKPEPQDERRYADPTSFAERTRFAPAPPPEPAAEAGHMFQPSDFQEPEPSRFDAAPPRPAPRFEPAPPRPEPRFEPEPTRFAEPVGQEPARFADPVEPTRFADPVEQPTRFAEPVGQDNRFANALGGREEGQDSDERYLDFLRSGGTQPEDTAAERGALSLGDHDQNPAEMTTILPPNSAETGPIEQTSMFPPVASGEDLPHRLGGERYADHVPFVDNQPGGGDARSGQLTPIGERGFLPFEKPLNPDEFTNKDLWVGENGQLIVSPENQPPADDRRWSDRDGQERTNSIQPPEQTAFTQPAGFTRHLPITGEDSPRSLFEPVVDVDRPNDQQLPPRPIRVRTGVNGNGRPPGPARAPAGSNGWQVGPFGPGSALPMPDGSAPAPQFRVKARTSSMVFHTEASPFFERLEPQVWFRSVEDAQRAGFTSWERPRNY